MRSISTEVGKRLIIFAFAVAGTLFSVLSIILLFVTWSELGVTTLWEKVVLFCFILFLSAAVSIVYICYLQKSKTIYECGSNRITLRYGDIIKLGFPRKNKEPRIVVIPVNTAFDTIVDDDVERIDYPLVSSHSIHGKWIKRMIAAGHSSEEIDRLIQEKLSGDTIEEYLRPDIKARGNLKCYRKGTIALIQGKQEVTFLLIALSEFDGNNTAHSSTDDVVNCIKRLLEFIDQHGQGHAIYIPLMGTGFSRADLSPTDSLLLMKAMMMLNCKRIHGDVNVVVYDKNRLQIPLV